MIAKVEHHLGELFPHVGFIVTALTGTNRTIVQFYNQPGTAEQWITAGRAAGSRRVVQTGRRRLTPATWAARMRRAIRVRPTGVP